MNSLAIRSDHVIVIPAEASPPVRTAAIELQDHFRQIAGLELPVVTAADAGSDKEILLGASDRLAAAAPDVDVAAMGEEEYLLRTDASRLIIVGGEPRGTLYGVYALLRDHLGCRWFTPELSHIPNRELISLGPLDVRYLPPLEYRTHFLSGTIEDPVWCARNQLNGFCNAALPEYGGQIRHWQFGHSFHDLLPPEKYYDEHPEYFALVRGKRLKHLTQPCCTSEDVIRVVTENLRQRILENIENGKEHPEQEDQVFYLAQNDWGNNCTCPKCNQLMENEEAAIAPLLYLCNRVVEELDQEFPAKSMMTIAYRFSRKPPRTMQAHPKLIVQLCSIECCFSHPLATCDCEDSVSFREHLAGWQRVAKRIWVWDYTAIFHQPFLPEPNIRILGENIKYFVDHGVSGIFEQDTGNREFAWLRSYLMARFLWDPSLDRDETINEFLEAYYDAAADPLRSYIDLVEDRAARDNVHVRYKFGSCPDCLSDDILAAADKLWDEAEAAVAGDSVLLERVRDERMHLLYAQVERERQNTLFSSCRVEGDRYKFQKPAELLDKTRRLVEWSKKHGRALNGFGLAGDDYAELVASEEVVLANGDLELVVRPRLGARITSMRAKPGGPNLFYTPAPASADFPALAGYRERWLSATKGIDESHSVVFSVGEATADESHACSQDEEMEFAQVMNSHGFLEYPLQFEQFIRLPAAGTRFRIDTLLANRGSFHKDSAMEFFWPLNLGDVSEVTVRFPAKGEDGDLSIPAMGLEFTAADVAAGLVLANRRTGLGVGYRPKAEGIEKVRVTVGPSASRIDLAMYTAAFDLVPGGSLWVYQELELLRGID